MFTANTIMFDLDGTLVDSVPDLAGAVDLMCYDLGLPARGGGKVRNWVGNGVRLLVQRAISDSIDPCPDGERVEDGLKRFFYHHANNCCEHSVLFPKVKDTLGHLQEGGYKLALITNKVSEFTNITLRHFELECFFDLTLSYDSLPTAKPSPEPLEYALRILGRPGLFIGDSATDVEAARNAGVPVICMSYGYNHGIDVKLLEPDVILDRLDGCIKLLKHAQE